MIKVIEIAMAERGYLEKDTAAALEDKAAPVGSGNYTKYARDLDAVPGFYNGPKQGYPWCEVFVDWCFVTAYGEETAKRVIFHTDCGAGCMQSAAAYRAAGRFDREPRAGDQVYFGKQGSETHTGIVYEVSQSSVSVIEGNSSDGVRLRMYSRDDKNICGYGHPAYELIGKEETGTEKTTFENDGLVECLVKVLQAMLISRGYSCGECGIDGELGPATYAAAKAYYEKKGR